MYTYLQTHQIVFITLYSSLYVSHTSIGVRNCLHRENWAQSLGWEDSLVKGMALEDSMDSIVHGLQKLNTFGDFHISP